MMTPIPYHYYSEALLSTHSNIFTYQWRHLKAFVKKLWIHFFSLGQKIFLCTSHWLPAHTLNTNTRGGCTVYMLKGSLSFTSFCGFQGRNEGEVLFTRILHFFSYFTNMLFFQRALLLPSDISSHTNLLPSRNAQDDAKNQHKLRTPPLHSYCCTLHV